jgi:hypothetical protein
MIILSRTSPAASSVHIISTTLSRHALLVRSNVFRGLRTILGRTPLDGEMLIEAESDNSIKARLGYRYRNSGRHPVEEQMSVTMSQSRTSRCVLAGDL